MVLSLVIWGKIKKLKQVQRSWRVRRIAKLKELSGRETLLYLRKGTREHSPIKKTTIYDFSMSHFQQTLNIKNRGAFVLYRVCYVCPSAASIFCRLCRRNKGRKDRKGGGGGGKEIEEAQRMLEENERRR